MDRILDTQFMCTFFINMSKFATKIKKILFCEVYVNKDFLIHSWLFFIRTPLFLKFFKRKIIFWIWTKNWGRSSILKFVFFGEYLKNVKKLWSAVNSLVICKFAHIGKKKIYIDKKLYQTNDSHSSDDSIS